MGYYSGSKKNTAIWDMVESEGHYMLSEINQILFIILCILYIYVYYIYYIITREILHGVTYM